MDFFQAQETARTKSRLLVFYFIAAVISIIAVVYAVAAGARVFEATQSGAPAVGWWQPNTFAFAALGTAAVIVMGSLFKTLSLRGGGGAVARSVGGKQIDPNTNDLQLRRLLNVVQEMALASGVRVPEVYLLPEQGINAFAAGYSPDDAAVAVTRGALDNLSRDELQGVIAHEFSHILNGDMRLNIRLIGLLFGILLIAIIGRTVFYSMRFSRLSSGRDKNSGGVIAAMLVLGVSLLIAGYMGVFFGRLIQAAVSRQREYLADASAVQFTRNPDGIAGALKRIGALHAGSQVRNVHAAETSHLFFANALKGSAFNLFATHPPLVQRIKAIDSSFDGKFVLETPPAFVPDKSRQESAAPRKAPPPLRPELFIAAIAAASMQSGAGKKAMEQMPAPLLEATRDPARARALIIGMLIADSAEAVDATVMASINDELSELESQTLRDLQAVMNALPKSARLGVVDLALPAVRHNDSTKFDGLVRCMGLVIAADKKTTLYEFALRRVVMRYLRPPAWTGARPGATIASYKPLANEISIVLSAIAAAGAHDPAMVQKAFSAGASQLGLIREDLALQSTESVTADTLTASLDHLDHAAVPIKKNLLEAMARAAAADGTIQPAEAELLRVIAAAIDCPAPPLEDA